MASRDGRARPCHAHRHKTHQPAPTRLGLRLAPAAGTRVGWGRDRQRSGAVMAPSGGSAARRRPIGRHGALAARSSTRPLRAVRMQVVTGRQTRTMHTMRAAPGAHVHTARVSRGTETQRAVSDSQLRTLLILKHGRLLGIDRWTRRRQACDADLGAGPERVRAAPSTSSRRVRRLEHR